MKTQYLQRILIGVGLMIALAVPWASATNYYVTTNGTGDGTLSWVNASSNLIGVVAVARDNDTVYVTNNATYKLTNQITVSYAITMRSWGPDGILDPTNTILDGNYPTTTNRHFQLNNYGATLAGFTLTKGCRVSAGGSIYLQNGIVTNCMIVSNLTFDTVSTGGGGVYMDGGSGGVWNCTISGNTSSNSGAGINVGSVGPYRIANCRISGSYSLSQGGGIYAGVGVFSNCWVVSNYAKTYGGGIYLVNASECHNSFIMGNTVGTYEGGGVRLVHTSVIRNCLIVNNLAQAASGGGVYANHSALVQSCTVASNVSIGAGGGYAYLYTAGLPKVENTIIWANSGGSSCSNWYIGTPNPGNAATNTFTNCCTSPRIVSAYATEVNTITNDPRFVNNATDYRLQSDSPCINAGVNRGWMEGAWDYYGNRRIDNFRKTVDIGAYEYLSRGTVFSGH